jgi:hypothetical protein
MESDVMQTSQLDLWQSEFGKAYTDRNDQEKPERVVSWRRLLDGIVPQRARSTAWSCGSMP